MEVLYQVSFKLEYQSVLARLTSAFSQNNTLEERLQRVRNRVVSVRNSAETTPSQKAGSEIVQIDARNFPDITPIMSLPHLRNVKIKGPALTFDIYCANPYQFDAYSSILTLASPVESGIYGTSLVDTFRYAHFNLEVDHSDAESISPFIDELEIAYGVHYAGEIKPLDADVQTKSNLTFSGTPWKIFNAHRAMQRFLVRSLDDYTLSEVDNLPDFLS